MVLERDKVEEVEKLGTRLRGACKKYSLKRKTSEM